MLNATPGSQSLLLMGNQTKSLAQANTLKTGATGFYVSFEADTVDAGIVFGPTQASVTSGNAPVLATTGVNAAGACARIFAGQPPQRYQLQAGLDLWFGYVGSAAGPGTLRVWVSSIDS